MHAFGEVGYTLVEDKKKSALKPCREETLFLINGQLNPLVNKFVHMPESHILLFTKNGNIKSTFKTVFPGIKHDLIANGADIMRTRPDDTRRHVSTQTDDFNPQVKEPEDKLVEELSESQSEDSEDDSPVNNLPEGYTVDDYLRSYTKPKEGDVIAVRMSDGTWDGFYFLKWWKPSPRDKKYIISDEPEDAGKRIPVPAEHTAILRCHDDPKYDIRLDVRPQRYGRVWRILRSPSAPASPNRRKTRASTLAAAMMNYAITLPAVVQMHNCGVQVQVASDGSDLRNHVLSKSRHARYKHARNLTEYFQLGAKLSDYHNDLYHGILILRNMPRDKYHLDSVPCVPGGEKGVTIEEKDVTINSYLLNHILNSKSRIKQARRDGFTGINTEITGISATHGAYSPGGEKYERAYAQLLLDKEYADALGISHSDYFKLKYHAESTLKTNLRLYGAMWNQELEILADMLMLSLHQDRWKDENTPDMSPVHTVCYAFTGKANGMDIVIEENEVASLKEWPESERPRMLDAIIKEVIGLAELGTFELPKLPITQKPIDSKFVLKVKYRADGTRDKSKARLVARGFQARLGVDYYSTFSPMASLTGVRALCSLAVSRGVLLMHADIPQAFIQSDLDAENSF